MIVAMNCASIEEVKERLLAEISAICNSADVASADGERFTYQSYVENLENAEQIWTILFPEDEIPEEKFKGYWGVIQNKRKTDPSELYKRSGHKDWASKIIEGLKEKKEKSE